MRYNHLKAIRKKVVSFDRKNKAFLILYGIYKQTIEPELEYNKFIEMYVSEDLVEIDFTCFYHDQDRVGFSAAFFYSAVINGRKAFIARSATGLIAEFQGRGLHNKYDLYLKFIRFALKHPTKKMWVGAFIINALIFRDLCKFVPVIFPKPHTKMSGQVQQVIDTILASGTHMRDEIHPFAHEVPIQVKFNDALLQRIIESKDPAIQWYLRANPRFLDKCGLLVIISVSARNIFGTISNFFGYVASRKLTQICKFCKVHGNCLMQKTAILVDTVAKRRIL